MDLWSINYKMGKIMTILITGASRGIGQYLLEEYKKEGHVVFGTYHSTQIADRKEYMNVDICDEDSVKKWLENIGDNLKNLVLINCAGINYNSFAHKADTQQWNEVIQVNVLGTFNVIRHVLPLMRNQGYGRIVNFSSVVTKLPTSGVSAYATSKAALVGLTKSLAKENASKGITINAINLGYVNAGMGINDVPSGFRDTLVKAIPTGRFCELEDVKSTIDYIIRTDYLNGAVIDLNGALV